jgi:hypothetical protein
MFIFINNILNFGEADKGNFDYVRNVWTVNTVLIVGIVWIVKSVLTVQKVRFVRG